MPIKIDSRLLFLIFLLMSLFSCNSSPKKVINKTNIRTIVFNPQPRGVNDDLLFSNVSLKDLKIIRMDNLDSNAMIAGTDRLFFRNNLIYNFELLKEKSISIFDSKGKFLKKIIKKGGGEDEYESILDGRINYSNGDVELLCNEGTKLIIYDSLGEFKKYHKIKTCSGPKNFCRIKDKYFFYLQFLACGESEHVRGYANRLIKSDESHLDKTSAGYLPYQFTATVPDAAMGLNAFSSLGYTKDTLILFESFNDTIYSINENDVLPRYVIEYEGEGKKPSDFVNNENIPNKSDYIRSNKLTNILNLMENDEYVWISYSYYFKKEKSRVVNSMLYNKIKNKTVVFQNNHLFSKIGNIPFYFHPFFIPFFMDNEGRFVSIIQPDNLISMLENEESDGPLHKFCTQFDLENLERGDNPVLLIYNIENK